MPTLDNLPVKLVKAVAGWLPKRDLSNLRLVNKKLEAKSFDVFKLSFKQKTIMIARPSLEALLAISENKRLGLYIRTLHVSSYRFLLRNLKDGVNTRTVNTASCGLIDAQSSSCPSESSDEQSVLNAHNIENNEGGDSDLDEDVHPAHRRLGFTSSQFQAFAAFLKDQTRSEQNNNYVQILSRAFTNLRNLRGINFKAHVTLCPKVATRDDDQVTGVLGICKILGAIGVANLPWIQTYSKTTWSFEPQLSCVLEAVAMSDLPLERLSARSSSNDRFMLDEDLSGMHYRLSYHNVSINSMLETFTRTSTHFPSIKSLALECQPAFESFQRSLMFTRWRDLATTWSADLEGMLKLFPNVSTLTLNSIIQDEDPMPLLTKEICLRKLTKLNIGAFGPTLKGLNRFLTAHHDTLQDTTFATTVLIDGEWNQLADTILQLPKLERLELKCVENQTGSRFSLENPAMLASLAAGLAVRNEVPWDAHNTNNPQVLGSLVLPVPLQGPPSQSGALNNTIGGGLAAFLGLPANFENAFNILMAQNNLPGPVTGGDPATGPAVAQAAAGAATTNSNSTSTTTGNMPQDQPAPVNQVQQSSGPQLPINPGVPDDPSALQRLFGPYNSVVLRRPDIAVQLSHLPF